MLITFFWFVSFLIDVQGDLDEEIQDSCSSSDDDLEDEDLEENELEDEDLEENDLEDDDLEDDDSEDDDVVCYLLFIFIDSPVFRLISDELDY